MSPLLTSLIGSFLGGLITWLAITGRSKWKKGRGMMGKPAKQAEENKKKMEAAQAERKKGRGEVIGALIYYLILVVAIFLLGFYLSAVVG